MRKSFCNVTMDHPVVMESPKKPDKKYNMKAKRQQKIAKYMYESVRKSKNKLVKNEIKSGCLHECPATAESINKFCQLTPTTGMSRFQERDIYNKIQARGLETTYPQLLNGIMTETKEEYLQVTLQAGIFLRIKSVNRKGLYSIQPYKYLGKSQRYNEFLSTRKQLSIKWILHYRVIRNLLKQCIMQLPHELFSLKIDRVVELEEFKCILNEKLTECKQKLQQFYNKILKLIHKETNLFLQDAACVNYLGTCTGLLSVHISRAIAHTLLHVVNFTDSKQLTPYLNLNITFNDGLIINPTVEEVINIYNIFLENIVETGKQFSVLEKTKTPKYIYLCITEKFLNSCKETVAANINKLYQPVVEYLKHLNETFVKIYSNISSNVFFESIADIKYDDGCERIVFCKEYLNKVAYIPDNEYFVIGEITLKSYRDTLYNGLKYVIDNLFNRLCDQHLWETNDICETFQTIYARAHQVPLTTEELMETGKYMTWIRDEHLLELTERVFDSLYLLTKIIQLGILADDHIAINSESINWLENIAPVIEQYFVAYEQLKFEAEEKLQKVIEDINEAIKKINPTLVLLDDMDNICTAHVYLHNITLHMLQIKEVDEQISWINKEEVCLTFPKSSYPEFNNLKNYVYEFYHLLKICVQVQRYLSVWLDGQFERLDYDEINSKVEKYYKELVGMQKTYRKNIRQAQDENLPLRFRGTVDDPDILNWPAPLKLCFKAIQLIDNFKPTIQVIKIMCNSALCKRHWMAMSEVAGFDVTPNAGTTLSKIMNTDLKADWSKYEIISIGATKEKQLRDKLTTLHCEWSEVQFTVDNYKNSDLLVLTQLEDIEAVIDDQTTKVVNMRGSVFVLPHEKDVMEFFKKILSIRKTVEGWSVVESQWIKLRPLFLWDHIKTILPTETTLFQEINNFHADKLTEINRNANVLHIVEKTNIVKGLQLCIQKLEIINKGVGDYLETVRKHFPRFYFLSNDDLIFIVSETRNLDQIQPYLTKLFEGIHNLVIHENSNITAMTSTMGEIVNFPNIVNTKDIEGFPEKWLALVENQMIHSVKNLVVKCLRVYKKVSTAKLIDDGFSQQSINVVKQICWTENIHKSLNSNIKLTICLQQIENSLIDQTKLLNENKLSNLQRHIVKSLVVSDINNKTVTKALLNSSDNHFLWETQLKHYFESGNCSVKLMQFSMKYLHEYLGNTDQIVVTPLTDRCFRTLINFYYLQLNGFLRGPTETGKSETIKNLAKALAVLLLPFNCSPDLSYQIISRFLKGMVYCGAWLCLKNANVLKCQVLSVMANDICSILSARKSGAKSFCLSGGIGDKLNPTCFICATINSTDDNITRALIPENIKMSFRTTVMIVPDLKIIAESLLQSHGFSEIRVLSRKIVTLFNLIADFVMPENRCLLGIRTLKTLILNCEQLKKKHPNENEYNILAGSFNNVIAPKLTTLQLKTFKSVTADVFPLNSPLMNVEVNSLEDRVEKFCMEANLDPQKSFIIKTNQTYNLIKIRHGVILVGAALTGKSTIIKASANLFYELDNVNVKCEIINPKCLTYSQLYGTFNTITNQWRDGILTRLIRNFTVEENFRHWLVFDGFVQSSCLENVNSVLDGEKKMCLASGEMIFLENSASVLIEVDNLSSFSPSTLSRCGVVYFEPSTVTWRSILKTWINNCEVFKSYSLISSFFDWILAPCLSFINNNCNLVIKTSDISLVRNMLELTRILLEDATKELNKKDEDLKNITVWIQATFIQSGVWGLGSTLDGNSRIKFDEFYKQLWKGQNKQYPYPKALDRLEISIPQDGTIFDYFYAYKQRGSWKYWPDVGKNEKISDSPYTSEIIIPTIDTIRYSNLIKNYIKYNYPILLVGPSGTGKSILMQDVLVNKLDKQSYELTCINFNESITTIQVQQNVLNKLNKKKLGHYTTSKNKTSIIFIDDLNSLPSDLGSSQPVIELLRQHLDHETWFDLYNLNTIYLHNVNFITSMGLPQGNLQHLCTRFLRHFSVFAINDFAEETVLKIYSGILQHIWKISGFPTDITSAINSIVPATLQIYQSIKSQLKPTLNNCHYVFNLTDYSKVIYGCANLKKETYDANKKIYLKLWMHEVLRVFSDRVSTAEDTAVILNSIKETIQVYFNGELEEHLENTEKNVDDFISENAKLLFGSFCDRDLKKDTNRRYEEISLKQVCEITKLCLNEYNSASKYKLDLVLFDYALEQLSKICRVISVSQNNALLIGLSGSGRQTLTKLACFMYKQTLFQPNITENYGCNQFNTDIKYILKEAGGLDEQCVLLVSEEQIPAELFLQNIDYVLKNNEISNLYDIDEKQEILKLVRFKAQGGNRNLDITSDSVFLFFNKRCKQNLHVILCLSPTKLRSRINRYSSLINCIIISFIDWPDESLKDIAQAWIKDLNIESSLTNKLADNFKYFHKQAQILSNCHESKDFVTSNSYLHFIKLFSKIMVKKQNLIVTNKKKYELGLGKLSMAANQISAMQTALAEYQPQLKEMTQKAIEMTKQIALETIQVEKASALVRKDEKIAHEQAEVAQVLKLECEAELAQAIPILEDAISALNTLKPTDITLVKSMKNPPDAIKLVMAAVCVIKDVRPDRIPDPSTGRKTLDYWGPSKRILGDMNFLQTLKDFDKDNIKAEIMVKIRKEYLPHKDFKPHVVAKASSAAEGLCKWIIAMDMYDKVAKEVAPKKEKLKNAEREYAETMAILNQKKEEVVRIEEKLAALNELLAEATRKQKKLQIEVDLCNRKLQRAQKLIGGLSGEKIKWTEAVDNLGNQYNNLTGDVMLSSALMVYLSSFGNIYRQHTVNDWYNYIRGNHIPCTTNGFDFINILCLDVQIDYLIANGLPDNQYFITNGLILEYSLRYSILIDPQYQASKWIKKAEKPNKLVVTNLSHSDYFVKIKNCITFGHPILMEISNEPIPLCLFALLTKQVFTTEDTNVFIEFNNETLQFNCNFKFFIISNKCSLQITPELCKIVSIINFQLTKDTLEGSLVKIVTEIEKPEYKKIQQELTANATKNKNDLILLDEKILRTLSKPETDILEDEEAMQILDESKDLAIAIRQRQNDDKTTQELISEYKTNYIAFASHSTNLYFCVRGLENIHYMYQFSLKWFKNIFFNSILNAEKSKCLRIRSKSLIESFTYDLYKHVTRSLFEKDKLLFSFLLCTSILIFRDEITAEEYTMFLKGPVMSKPLTKTFNNPLPEILSDVSWGKFRQIECIKTFNGIVESFTINNQHWGRIFTNNFVNKTDLPAPWCNKLSPFHKLIILRFFNSEYLYDNILIFITNSIGSQFINPLKIDITKAFNESYSLSPLLFILSPDINPVNKIINLVRKKKLLNKFQRLSLGNNQEPTIRKLMEEGQAEGSWVLLENCHLAVNWLKELDEKIVNMDFNNTHENFRIWLTTEPTTNFPTSLLQNSIKIIDECPAGLKQNLLKLYKEEPLADSEFFFGCPGKHETFTKSLYAIACFHVVLRERFKYDLVNWKTPYLVNKTNFLICILQLQKIVNETSYDIKTLGNFLSECNYSELMMDEWQERLLQTLLNEFLNLNVLKQNFCLPSRSDYQDFLNHICKLPDGDNPEIIGLHDSSIVQVWRNNVKTLFPNPTEMESAEDECRLTSRIFDILPNLPEEFETSEFKQGGNIIILREMKQYNQLLNVIRTTLTSLKASPMISATLQEDATAILRDGIPRKWLKYSNSCQINLPCYLENLKIHCQYFKNLTNDDNLSNNCWLTAFYFPKAVLYWTKINYSKKSNLPVENITFDFEVIGDNATEEEADSNNFLTITGLWITGASWDRKKHCLVELLPKKTQIDLMPPIRFKPINCNETLVVTLEENKYQCPLYKNYLFKPFETNFLVAILLKTELESTHWTKRGVRLLCQINSDLYLDKCQQGQTMCA